MFPALWRPPGFSLLDSTLFDNSLSQGHSITFSPEIEDWPQTDSFEQCHLVTSAMGLRDLSRQHQDLRPKITKH